MNIILNSDIKYFLEVYEKTKSYDNAYAEYINKYPDTDLCKKSFIRRLERAKKKILDNDQILESANLSYNFTPYRATVEVDKNGNIVRSWIKQNADSIEKKIDELINSIKANTSKTYVNRELNLEINNENKMLEIPLFDMHFGIASYDYYSSTLLRLLNIVKSKYWDEINIIIGQDLFHNDNFNGTTSKGTIIEKIDITTAWNDAKCFYDQLITESLIYSKNVNIYYSKGNHDKTLSWAFVQLLKEMFPQVTVYDSLDARKCITWKKCFIGFGHCEYKQNSPAKLFKQFVVDFPLEFANAKIKEIHTGHLHTEKDAYIDEDTGIMVRRLSSGNVIDEWTSDNGFVGSHKRFMVFEYEPDFLSDIHYV